MATVPTYIGTVASVLVSSNRGANAIEDDRTSGCDIGALKSAFDTDIFEVGDEFIRPRLWVLSLVSDRCGLTAIGDGLVGRHCRCLARLALRNHRSVSEQRVGVFGNGHVPLFSFWWRTITIGLL